MVLEKNTLATSCKYRIAKYKKYGKSGAFSLCFKLRSKHRKCTYTFKFHKK